MPSNTIYEISKLIPEFISEILIAEVSESRRFIGRFNIGYKYYIEEYFGAFDVWKFQDTTIMFRDYSQPINESSKLRYLIVTDTAIIVCEPTAENK